MLHDLRGFLETPLPAPNVAAVARQAEERRASSRPSFLQGLPSSWRSYTEWLPPRAVGATAALLLFVGAAALGWYALGGRTVEETQVARDSPPPVAATSPQPASMASPSPTTEEPGGGSVAAEGGQQPRPPSDRNTERNGKRPAAARKGVGRAETDGGDSLAGLASLSPADRQAVERALRTQQVEAPESLAALSGGAETLRGGGGPGVSFPVLSPVGTAVITDRRTFRWRALSGASSYVVSVYDRDFRKVAASAPQAGTEWTVTQSLARGRVYSCWHVSAQREGREVTSPEQPAPEAKFRILDGAKAEELSRAGRVHKDSHLTLGTLYARAGLLDLAERELQSALLDNPRSRVARRLLLSVQALRGAAR